MGFYKKNKKQKIHSFLKNPLKRKIDKILLKKIK